MNSTNIAICASPQHVMNLVQAHLAGIMSGPVSCLVLEHSDAEPTFGRSVLHGTIDVIRQLCPTLSVKHLVLRSPLANIRIAKLARYARLDPEGTLLLGLYPSPLWARSPVMELARQVVLLDDGASSLSLDLARVFEGRMVSQQHPLLARAIESATGEVRLPRNSPVVYTCFPVDARGATVVRHEYTELRSALPSKGALAGEAPPASRIWVDSNYSWLSAKTHMDLVRSAVQQFGIEAYVPHRRTERTLVSTMSREMGLTVLRPRVPLELLIGSWTRQGATLITPPTSLVHTASLFLESPGQLIVAKTSEWLRIRAISASANEANGLAMAINHAVVVEQSIQSPEPSWVVALR